MTPLQEKLKTLVIKARQIHAQERDTVIDSLQVIGELAAWRAELFMGGKHERVAQEVGLTADQYFKRLRVARLAHDFPLAIQYLREGRTCLSHLALLSDKITKANEQVIWDHVLDKGRREVEDFLRRVECDGSLKDKADGRITIQITVTADEEALIHRLTEVLSARGHVPTRSEALMEAVTKLLDQRDPQRRAEKMAEKDRTPKKRTSKERTPKKRTHTERPPTDKAPEAPQKPQAPTVARQSPGTTAAKDDRDLLSRGSPKSHPGETSEAKPTRIGRRKIPESVKREVFRRAQGCCQHVMADGKPCGATRMLEIDHIVPVARGGGDELSNLTLVCREHNYYRAWVIMGPQTMERYR